MSEIIEKAVKTRRVSKEDVEQLASWFGQQEKCEHSIRGKIYTGRREVGFCEKCGGFVDFPKEELAKLPWRNQCWTCKRIFYTHNGSHSGAEGCCPEHSLYYYEDAWKRGTEVFF